MGVPSYVNAVMSKSLINLMTRLRFSDTARDTGGVSDLVFLDQGIKLVFAFLMCLTFTFTLSCTLVPT